MYYIDGAGNLLYQGMAGSSLSFGRHYAIDSLDRFFYATGGSVDFLQSCIISPVDGTANTCPAFISDLGFSNSGMLVESSGHFLYLGDDSPSVAVFSIDQTTGTPTQVGSITGITLQQGSSVADPMGPYIYSGDVSTISGGGIHAYLVDQQSGSLTEIPGSPFNPGAPACCEGLAITGNPVQAISGPAATIFPSTASTFTATAGTISSAQLFSIVNVGNQLLSINSISIAGRMHPVFLKRIPASQPSPLMPTVLSASTSIRQLRAPSRLLSRLLITVSLNGTAVAAFSVAAAAGSSTTASVSAGQAAQYQLQMTPGTGFTGTVSLRCSGAPLGAVCQVPASISLTNGAATAFTVTVTTSGPALLPPTPLRLPPISKVPLLPLVALALILWISLTARRTFGTRGGRRRFALCGILTAAIFSAVLGIAGCGGGSAAVGPPPPVITPSGTSTISVTPSATSSSGQALQLQPIQLMLTVQ